MDNLTAHNAADYDQKVRQTIPFYDTIHGEVLRLVKIIKPEAKCWVDTGCGTGRLVQQALASFPATQFILADPSEAMLGQARGRFSSEESARLKILPPMGSADLVFHIGKREADVLTAIQCHHYLQREERIPGNSEDRQKSRPRRSDAPSAAASPGTVEPASVS